MKQSNPKPSPQEEIATGWLSIEIPPADGLIKTLHSDGKEDISKVINGVIYIFDQATDAPITHYKQLNVSTPTPSVEAAKGYTEIDVRNIINMVCDQFNAGFAGRNEFVDKVISEYPAGSKYSGQDQESLWEELLEIIGDGLNEELPSIYSVQKAKERFTITRKSEIKTGKEKGEKE